jgi:hypothetical protein
VFDIFSTFTMAGAWDFVYAFASSGVVAFVFAIILGIGAAIAAGAVLIFALQVLFGAVVVIIVLCGEIVIWIFNRPLFARTWTDMKAAYVRVKENRRLS